MSSECWNLVKSRCTAVERGDDWLITGIEQPLPVSCRYPLKMRWVLMRMFRFVHARSNSRTSSPRPNVTTGSSSVSSRKGCVCGWTRISPDGLPSYGASPCCSSSWTALYTIPKSRLTMSPCTRPCGSCSQSCSAMKGWCGSFWLTTRGLFWYGILLYGHMVARKWCGVVL